jgi:hypothetical protein
MSDTSTEIGRSLLLLTTLSISTTLCCYRGSLPDFPAGLLLIFCYVSGTVVGFGGFLLGFCSVSLLLSCDTEIRLAWVDRWQAPLKIILKLNVGFFLDKICRNCYNSTHACAGKINEFSLSTSLCTVNNTL